MVAQMGGPLIVCDTCDARASRRVQLGKLDQHGLPLILNPPGWITAGPYHHCPACWKRLEYTRQQQGKEQRR